jgi:hypothetical protein
MELDLWSSQNTVTDDAALEGQSSLAYTCKTHRLAAELVFSPQEGSVDMVSISTLSNALLNGCSLVVQALSKENEQFQVNENGHVIRGSCDRLLLFAQDAYCGSLLSLTREIGLSFTGHAKKGTRSR